MSLVTEVQARYDNQSLVELTNPRDPSGGGAPTTPNATKLAQAASSIQNGYFPLYVNATYDSTDALHVEIACEGVIALLFKWGGTATNVASVTWAEWVERAQALAEVDTGARDKILPTSNSSLTRSTEVEAGETVRPAFDDDAFRQNLNPPNTTGRRPGTMP